ncbi:MAG: hypothetical protein OEX82_09300 [Nitrosomonas sp.]|nr:hypothetical protein [Nitrosomonas sp.]
MDAVCSGAVRPVMQGPAMRESELNRISPALHKLTPVRRKIVATTLAVQPQKHALSLTIQV